MSRESGGETVTPQIVEAPWRRVFLGVKIADEIARELVRLARDLEQSGAHLVRVADVHLTLVPPWNVVDPSKNMREIEQTTRASVPFQLAFERLCYGPDRRRPRLLWATCAASEELAALRAALLQASGQRDDRLFRPHVTLARLRGNGPAIARRHPIDAPLPFVQEVDTVELFQSPPPGTRGYRILASIGLGREK